MAHLGEPLIYKVTINDSFIFKTKRFENEWIIYSNPVYGVASTQPNDRETIRSDEPQGPLWNEN
jgi:hypothetical protein